MPKWLRYGLAGIGAAALALVVLTLIINSIDQKLRPEVKVILAKPVNASETQKRAYYFLLGLYAGETAEPEKKGQELWADVEKPGFWKTLEHKNYFKADPPDCGGGRVCTVKALEAKPELAATLVEHETLIKKYIQLMEFGEGVTLFRGNSETVFAPISGLPYQPHGLFLLQLSDWLRKGGQIRVIDLLISSNHYARSFLNQGTFLESMLAVVIISRNAAFAKAEMERNPKFRPTQELLESFTIPRSEDILFSAMETELASANRALHAINTISDFDRTNLSSNEKIENGRLVGKIPARLIFRPNEAVNRYYEIISQSLTADCLGNIAYTDCVPAARWAEPRYPWSWLSNPVGRAVVRIMSFHLAGMRTKIDARRNDVAIVQELIREKL